MRSKRGNKSGEKDNTKRMEKLRGGNDKKGEKYGGINQKKSKQKQ